MDKLERFSVDNFKNDFSFINFSEILQVRNPIIFDTNFLFITFEFKIDIISELKKIIGGEFNLFIYAGTIEELKDIEKHKTKNKKFLPLIITMLKRYNFKIIKSDEKYVDAQILSNLNSNVILATNDKALRLEIWKRRYKVLYLRQKAYLEIK